MRNDNGPIDSQYAVTAPIRTNKNFGALGFTATPKPAPPAPPQAPSMGSTGGGMSSGRIVGSNSSGRVSGIAPAPPAPPAPPSLDSWLAGDSTYQSQMNAAQKAYADYVAQMTGQQANYQTEYNRNLGDIQHQQELDTTGLNDDYAGRGLMNSGLYVKALGDLNTDYSKKDSTLADALAQFLSNNQAGLGNFKSTQGIDQNKYRQDAINRRASMLGQ